MRMREARGGRERETEKGKEGKQMKWQCRSCQPDPACRIDDSPYNNTVTPYLCPWEISPCSWEEIPDSPKASAAKMVQDSPNV